ncbi:CBU_0592 family membrane protein [Pseudaestuariivita atlantica]|uniref:CBU-0592-like domain-containing protein n=1 Tax=Pseudaestuariivita atlantica TaxID=1317121 RepID=A0A0L1JS16_9RHOB|nr:hypothetical protein [Pseudaestuariivita atlantica]KNG94203.1 hypothetical protein ATO11_08250 [Pseudaestuariivita atlantica]
MIADFTVADWIGVAGSFTIAGAYLAVTRGWVDAARPTFHLINLSGAVMILFSLYFRPNPGAILIEVLWVAIASIGLLAWWRGR